MGRRNPANLLRERVIRPANGVGAAREAVIRAFEAGYQPGGTGEYIRAGRIPTDKHILDTGLVMVMRVELSCHIESSHFTNSLLQPAVKIGYCRACRGTLQHTYKGNADGGE